MYKPFNRRILFPSICGDSILRWKLLTYISLVALPFLVAVYVNGNWQQSLFAIILMAGLPSMQFWYKNPVLVDAPAICMALAAALLPWPYNLAVVTVGAFGRETVPVFAAIYAWNPVLLLGLIPVISWMFMAPQGTDQLKRENWLDHPIKTAVAFKKGKWLNPDYMIFPWGAGLLALFNPSFQLATAAGIAYAQLLVATDWTRLYVWAAPVVILNSVYIGGEWMIPLAVIHLFNPKRGDGA